MKVGVREQPEAQRRPELYPEPDLDIPILPEDPEVIAEREGIHKRIQSEIQHQDKEAEVAVEEMLEVPPEWNEVADLMMEDEASMMITEAATKGKKLEGGGKGRRKMISDQRNVNILPRYLGEHENPAGFYSEDWDEFQQKEMNGRCQINGRGFHRWCFMADVWR